MPNCLVGLLLGQAGETCWFIGRGWRGWRELLSGLICCKTGSLICWENCVLIVQKGLLVEGVWCEQATGIEVWLAERAWWGDLTTQACLAEQTWIEWGNLAAQVRLSEQVWIDWCRDIAMIFTKPP